MPAPAVALFDIDGTLVHTGGAGGRSWMHAFGKLHGVPADIGQHTSAGETDPFVARKTFEAVLGRPPTRDELGRLFAEYLLHLSVDIWRSPGYRVLDGVEETLTRLAGAGVVLGLVSGAMEGAARTKLIPANLNRFFVFGGYGSDSPDRMQLTRTAIRKAFDLHDGRLDAGDIVVVGDTPLDIEATTRAGGTPLGVATGNYSQDELRAAGAEHVVASLATSFPGIP